MDYSKAKTVIYATYADGRWSPLQSWGDDQMNLNLMQEIPQARLSQEELVETDFDVALSKIMDYEFVVLESHVRDAVAESVHGIGGSILPGLPLRCWRQLRVRVKLILNRRDGRGW